MYSRPAAGGRDWTRLLPSRDERHSTTDDTDNTDVRTNITYSFSVSSVSSVVQLRTPGSAGASASQSDSPLRQRWRSDVCFNPPCTISRR